MRIWGEEEGYFHRRREEEDPSKRSGGEGREGKGREKDGPLGRNR